MLYWTVSETLCAYGHIISEFCYVALIWSSCTRNGYSNEEKYSALNRVIRHVSCDPEFTENDSLQGPGEVTVLPGTNEGLRKWPQAYLDKNSVTTSVFEDARRNKDDVCPGQQLVQIWGKYEKYAIAVEGVNSRIVLLQKLKELNYTKIICLLCNLEVRYGVHRSPPLGPILSLFSSFFWSGTALFCLSLPDAVSD